MTFDGTTLTATGFSCRGVALAIDLGTGRDIVGFYGATPVLQGTATPYSPSPLPPATDPAFDALLANEFTAIASAISDIITALSQAAGGVGLIA